MKIKELLTSKIKELLTSEKRKPLWELRDKLQKREQKKGK